MKLNCKWTNVPQKHHTVPYFQTHKSLNKHHQTGDEKYLQCLCRIIVHCTFPLHVKIKWAQIPCPIKNGIFSYVQINSSSYSTCQTFAKTITILEVLKNSLSYTIHRKFKYFCSFQMFSLKNQLNFKTNEHNHFKWYFIQ